MTREIPRLMLAAPYSGSGKTTLTCALLQALKSRGLSPTAFKCGPDYIDPMFHTEVLQTPSRNLDLFFTPEQTVRGLLCKHAGELTVLEGVMGYYDGVGQTTHASSWHLASATATPVVLVVDPKGMMLSLAAMLRGFLAFREEHRIAGVILNRCKKALYASLKLLLEAECGIPVLGYLEPMPECAVESRHLGLVTAQEVENLRQKVERLGKTAEQTIDIARLLEVASAAPLVEADIPKAKPVTNIYPIIAVARDRAFCFYYRDNLDLLEELGARLAFFSPLHDTALPKGASALYLGGGYPELHAAALAQNEAMRAAIRQAVQAGMPTLAECGGFQYLQEFLTDAEGLRHPMAGVISSTSEPAGGLRRFGYITLTAERETLLCKKGESIPAHEFHHWDSDITGNAFTASKPGGTRSWSCMVAEGKLLAGYPHLYFYGNQGFARSFVQAAAGYAATPLS